MTTGVSAVHCEQDVACEQGHGEYQEEGDDVYGELNGLFIPQKGKTFSFPIIP